jgi:(R,R)-butanediol dehydrogenase / meso-butanediol dehydrogenase / diacetyl reductase
MKALRWYGPQDLRYVDIAEPSPGKGQVKVKINLAGICGSEVREYAFGPLMLSMDKAPLTQGHEFAGRVDEVGEGVKDFEIGDRVTGLGYRFCGECYFCKRGQYNHCLNGGFTGMSVDGCMAEYMVAPAYSLYKLPPNVSDEAGALVEPLSVAIHAVNRANIQYGDVIAIVGDGTIGLCTLMAARAAGAFRIYLVSKRKGRGHHALSMGANEVIYITEADPVKKIASLTNGLGVDKSFECAGAEDAPQLSLDIIRTGGTAVFVGLFEKPASLNTSGLVFMEKNIVGSSIYIDEATAAIDQLAEKRINPLPLVTSKVPLKDAVESGFKRLIADEENNIKILLKVP